MKTRRIFRIGFFLDANLYGEDFTRSADTVGDVRELYSFGNLHKFDLKLGRQIIVWGRADKVNPTDSLSVRDLTFLAPNDDDQRTGVFTAQQTYTFGDSRIIAVWQPEWREPKFPIPELPAGVSIDSSKPENPERQFALKFDRTGGDVDFSFSYFNGIDRVPDLELAPGLGLNILLAFKPIEVFGADAAFNLGSYGLRAEVAYTKTGDDGGDSPTTKNSFWFGVIGADRSISENLNVNLQYMIRSIDNWQSPNVIANPVTKLLAQEGQLLANQQQAFQQGLTVRVLHRALEQTLETELAGIVWFQKGDSLFRPKITYSFNDRWKGILGAEIYSGPQDSHLGRLVPYTSGFTEVRYFF
jgi:hypothetical protein